MPKALDLKLNKYGKLTAIERVGSNNRGLALWDCKCDCGNTVKVISNDLIRGRVKSCGCLKGESNRKLKTIHGDKGTRLYRIWNGIKSRCFTNGKGNYQIYGARGITMCGEWAQDYLVFKEWALKNGYDDFLSIERIDVNGNYDPENCKWADNIEQCNNRRNNVFYEYNGKSMTLAQWSRELDINISVLEKRIYAGWEIEKAFTKPIRAYNK